VKNWTEKPDWFELKSYAGLDKLSPQEWATLLGGRKFWRDFLEVRDYPSNSEHKQYKYYGYLRLLKSINYVKKGKYNIDQTPLTKKGQEFINEKMLVSLQDDLLSPLSRINDKEIKEYNQRVFFEEIYGENGELFSESIRPVTIGELMELHQWVPRRFEISKKNGEYTFSPLGDNWRRDSIKLVEQTVVPYMKNGFRKKPGIADCYLGVDLKATDETLVQDFKKYISKARKRYGYSGVKNMRSSLVNELFHKRVIQYIDLNLWLKAHNKSLRQHQIANIIFEDDIDLNLPEKLRQQTIPLVKRASTEEFIHALFSSPI
jgi:hypothetical protein